MMQMCPWQSTSSCPGSNALLAFPFPPIHPTSSPRPVATDYTYHLFLLSWVRNPRLKAFLDTYHAPYKPKHQYWTGLLLLLHCALFLAFAFNISGNDSVNLLVISSTAFGIIVGFALSGMVYKSWYLHALEVSFILNLGIPAKYFS